MIRVAALLHDYGQIGVPDAILKKSGRLTSAEFEIVKTHAAQTKKILQRVNFEGIFKEVPNIAGAHHERFDGKGYPDGMRGQQIPLGARIIAVADFFEAVTAERQYHEPMPSDQALELLRTKEGSHFDPEVVAAFINHFFNRQTSFQPPKLVSM
jgi:HD-GYP domain-containing protein (c-di-GMP phosphodiesterase class II)